jgi:hypothetical protein
MPRMIRIRARSPPPDPDPAEDEAVQEGDPPPEEALRPQDLEQVELEAAAKSQCEEWSHVIKNRDGSWTCKHCNFNAMGGPPRIR